MDYPALLQRLVALSPKGIELGLDRVRLAAQQLGDPHTQLTVIQVAGTNGKGSVCSLLEGAFRNAGATTGLYTSPHLHRFTERIRVNGQEVAQEAVGQALEQVFEVVDRGLSLTFFEVTTLAAVTLFAQADVDVVIMEVGLGGRLDATSVVYPSVTVITSIGMDHMDYLGNTIGEIAAEKAGICRPGVPLYCGPLGDEALKSVERVAGASLVAPRLYGRDFDPSPLPASPVPGAHMRQNAALARQVFVETAPVFEVAGDTGAFDAALASLSHPARFEQVTPEWLLDGAHNLEAALALVSSLEEAGFSVGTLVFGALVGKPFEAMAQLLFPLADRVIVVPPPVSRAFDAETFARSHGKEVVSHMNTVFEMVDPAPGKINLVTGSFFLAAEARRILLDENADFPVAL